jgi:hypothetical protein
MAKGKLLPTLNTKMRPIFHSFVDSALIVHTKISITATGFVSFTYTALNKRGFKRRQKFVKNVKENYIALISEN